MADENDNSENFPIFDIDSESDENDNSENFPIFDIDSESYFREFDHFHEFDHALMDFSILGGDIPYENDLSIEPLELPKDLHNLTLELNDNDLEAIGKGGGAGQATIVSTSLEVEQKIVNVRMEEAISTENGGAGQAIIVAPNLKMEVDVRIEGEDNLKLLPETALSVEAVELKDQEIEMISPVVLVLQKKNLGKKTHEREREPASSSSGAVAVPEQLSFKLPKGFQAHIGLTTNEQQPIQATENIYAGNEGGDKNKTTWSKLVNFQLPSDIHQSIEIMDMQSHESSSCVPLAERLQGWMIKQVTKSGRKRADKIYHHQSSRKTFRSFLEVETYIVYAGRKQHLSCKKRRLEEPPRQIEQPQEQSSGSLLGARQENPTSSADDGQRIGKGYLKVSGSIETSYTYNSDSSESTP